MENLQYTELKIQNYLENDQIKVDEARTLFKFRTRMMKCWGNFKGGKPQQICQLCCEPSTTDTQEHLFRGFIELQNIEVYGSTS